MATYTGIRKNAGRGDVTSAIIGGTVSEMTSGKFANGAVTAAFSYAMGHAADSSSQSYHDENIGFFGRIRRAFSSHPMELESSVIKDAMLSAWHDAQTGDPYLRHEEGGFWGYESDGSYGVRRWPPGTRSEIIVPRLEDGNMFKGLWVQSDFHVHPSPRPIDEFGVKRHLAPSPGDLRQTKRFNLPGNSCVIDNVNVYWMNRSGSWGIIGRSEDVFR